MSRTSPFWRKRGQFRIPGDLLDKQPLRLKALFKDCVVIECHYEARTVSYYYFALHEKFDEISEEIEAPNYAIKWCDTKLDDEQGGPVVREFVGFERIK